MNVYDMSAAWLCAAKIRVKQSTYGNYETKLDKHILPELGETEFAALTTERLNKFIADKLRGGLSASYVCDIAAVLKIIGKYAAKTCGLHNPCANISLPKKAAKEVKILSDTEQSRLILALAKNPCLIRIGILIAIFTGMRIGEICALTWGDVDFEARKIHVSKNVSRIKNNSETRAKTKLIITAPKSAKSVRDIPVPLFLLNILRAARECGDFYILSGTKTLPQSRTVQYHFKAILKELGLQDVKFHSLRHAFATKCIRTAGFDVKTLSEILGHSSVATTMKMYVHTSDEHKRKCMDLVDFAA